MKKMLTFCSVLFVVALLSINAQAQLALTDGLVAYYPFDNNVADASGENNDGRVDLDHSFNPTPTTDRYGRADSAYLFDGVDDFIEIPHSDSLNMTTELTISLWVKFDESVDNWQVFVAKGDYWNETYGLIYHNTFRELNFWHADPDNSAYTSWIDPLIPYNDVWHHIAAVYKSDQTKIYTQIYVDSNLEVSTEVDIAVPRTGMINTNEKNFLIGRVNVAPYYHLNGALDDLVIYNRSLTEEDIGALYASDDYDNDGIGNRLEVALGTNPFDPTSRPVFLSEEQYADFDGDGDFDGDDLGHFAKVFGKTLWFVDQDGDGYGDPSMGFYWVGQPEPAWLFAEQSWGVLEIDLGNGVSMNLKLIPSGSFVIGSPEGESGRNSDEILHGGILIEPFYMQTTEVTQRQWLEVMGNNPSYFQNCGLDCPVEMVSWDDVQIFLSALNSQTGHNFRLPTETQWEYAARAGSVTAFASGDLTGDSSSCANPVVDSMAWYCFNSSDTTHPVAQKLSNAWGLYDMHGNVWEWVQDWYGPYPTANVIDPKGPETGTYRVNRSGSWNLNPRFARSAYRGRHWPDSRINYLGFRLVLPSGQ